MISNKRDFLAGLMFAGIGAVAMAIATNYRMGTPVRMGAGFFPMILTGILILLGLIIMVSALRSREETLPQVAWRPLIVIPVSVVVFAFLINIGGLFLSTAAVIVASRLARPGHPWMETILLAVGTTIVVSIVFYYGLGLNLPLWPQFG